MKKPEKSDKHRDIWTRSELDFVKTFYGVMETVVIAGTEENDGGRPLGGTYAGRKDDGRTLPSLDGGGKRDYPSLLCSRERRHG